MGETISKQELLETMRTEREKWDALLEKVGQARMGWSGASGEWSVKDVIAHLAAWESRVVAWFEAAHTGSWPTPPPWPTNLSETETNEWIYRANRGRSLDDVLQESRRVYNYLVELVAGTPEADLQARDRFEWLRGSSLAGSIGGNSYEHYRDHAEWMRNWLAQLGPQPQVGGGK